MRHCRVRPLGVKTIIEDSLTTWGPPMKKQILIVTAAALTAAVVILSGTSAATAQQTPQYQVGGFPYDPAPDVGVAALRQHHRAAAP